MKTLLWFVLSFFLCITSADAASRFGICVTTCTWDSSSTAMWSATSGGATGASVPGASDDVTFDAATCVGGVSCTITVNFGGTVTINTLTMGACTASTNGCIFDNSVNNNNFTFNGSASFNGSGSGTRNIKLGSATYTVAFTSAATNFNFATTTNLTFSGASANVVFSNATGGGLHQFNGGGKSWGSLALGTMTSGGRWAIFQSNTFGVVTLTAGSYVVFGSGFTQTITNAVNWAGTGNSVTGTIGISSGTLGTVGTLVLTTGSVASWASFHDITVTGSTLTATNSMNLFNNTNISAATPASGGGCILGGWLLWRDMPEHVNDNFPAWLEKAA